MFVVHLETRLVFDEAHHFGSTSIEHILSEIVMLEVENNTGELDDMTLGFILPAQIYQSALTR